VESSDPDPKRTRDAGGGGGIQAMSGRTVNDKPASCANPLTVSQARSILDECGRFHPGTRALWLAISRKDQPSPKAWMDAYLAAIAITHDLEMVTFDQGFAPYRDSGLNLRLLPDL